MRWFVRAVAAFLVLLAAYAAWPLLGLRSIAKAVETRDGAAFSQLLDIPALRRSLTEQIARAYLLESDKTRRLSPFALSLAVQVAMGIADPVVIELLKSEALMELLRKSGSRTFLATGIGIEAWDWPNLRNVQNLIGATAYRGRSFYVWLPLNPEIKERYRLRLRLTNWTWKLAGVELPDEIKIRLVQELLKKAPR